jgi:predicted ester cyclase
VSSERGKEIVRRFYREAISERDAGACERLLTPDFAHNGEARGRAGQHQAVAYFLAAFPDLEHEIVLILGEGDLVAAHQRWSGTHGGEFLGFAPTGRRVEFTSTAILRIEGELIAEAWDELDSGAIAAQLDPSESD